jgi:hypothetical protein
MDWALTVSLRLLATSTEVKIALTILDLGIALIVLIPGGPVPGRKDIFLMDTACSTRSLLLSEGRIRALQHQVVPLDLEA